MSTSLHDGRILQQIDLTAESSLNSAYVRDVVFNNLSHYADEFGQVLVNWTRLGSGFSGSSIYEFSLDQTVSFGPFSLKTRQDGAPYVLRVRVAGSRVSGSATDKVFRVTVCPRAQSLTVNEAASTTSASYGFVTQTITSSTVAWLTGASYAGDTNLIIIPAGVAAGWLTQTQTLESVAGDPSSVEQCLVDVNVRCTGGTTTAISLDGLYVAEYIGA